MGELGPNFGIDQCGVDQQISPQECPLKKTRHGTEWGSFFFCTFKLPFQSSAREIFLPSVSGDIWRSVGRLGRPRVVLKTKTTPPDRGHGGHNKSVPGCSKHGVDPQKTDFWVSAWWPHYVYVYVYIYTYLYKYNILSIQSIHQWNL